MSEEKLRVLRMLEQGIITYAQSLELLAALGDKEAPAEVPGIPVTLRQAKEDAPDRTADVETSEDDEDDLGDANNADHTDDFPGLGETWNGALETVRQTMREVSQGLQGVRGEVSGDLKETMRGVSMEIGAAMKTVGTELRGAFEEVKSSEGWNLLPGIFGSHNYTFREAEEIALSPSTTSLQLLVDTKNGHIRVIAGETETIKLQVVKKIQAESEPEARAVAEAAIHRTVEQKEAQLFLSLVVPEEVRGAAISFDLLIPKRLRCVVQARSKNGSLHLEEITGSADLESKNGGLRVVGGVYQDVKAYAKNGSVALLTSVENATVETKNGSIRCLIKPQSMGVLRASSYNGSILLEFPEANDQGYSVDAATVHGSVQVSLAEFQAGEISRQRVVGQTNGFSQKSRQLVIAASTKNGGITVKKL